MEREYQSPFAEFLTEDDDKTGNHFVEKELMAMDNRFSELFLMIRSTIEQHQEDPILISLYNNIVSGAIRYLKNCIRLEIAKRNGEKDEIVNCDDTRTRSHTAAMDDWNIFHRYLRKKNIPISWSFTTDRNEIGEMLRALAGEELANIENKQN